MQTRVFYSSSEWGVEQKTEENSERSSWARPWCWKIINALCLVLCVWGLTPRLLAAELGITNVKARPGSAFILPVTVSGGETSTAIHFCLRFDGGLVSLPDTLPPVNGELIVDHTIGTNWYSNRARVLVFSGSLSALRPGSGTLLYLVLQLAASAAVGTVIPVAIEELSASDANGNPVPMTARAGAITVSNDLDLPGPGSHQLVFPQVADGSFPGGSFLSSLVFVNRTAAGVTGRISFSKSDGTPMALGLVDGRRGSEFTFTVPGGGSVFLQTNGSSPLAVGYARLTSTGPLGGTILFSQLDGSGRVLLEAGVGAAPGGTRFSIPVLYVRGSVDTGVAFANTSGQPVELQLKLRDKPGNDVDSAVIRLGIGEHLPKFATELFDSLPGQSEFAGLVEVEADQPVSAIALKLQGLILTTFPVIATIYTPPSLPHIEVTPASLNFGTIYTGSSKSLDFTVKNTGEGELQVESITKSSASYVVTSPAVPFTVAPGGEQKVSVSFSPTAGGTASGTLTVNSNDLVQPSVTVAVTGTGNPGAAPVIQSVTVTKLANFTIKVDIQLSDADGDISKLDFQWYRATAVMKTSTLNSPADVNLAGFTAGTISYTFTNMGIGTFQGLVFPNKVEVTATDSRGLVSNAISKSF